MSSDSCPRQGTCGCVGIPAALLSPLDGGLVFPHLSCLPGRSCRVSFGVSCTRGSGTCFLGGSGSAWSASRSCSVLSSSSSGCAEEGPPSPSVPSSGPVCQVFSFQGLVAFWFCSKPICKTHFRNLSDNVGSSSVCFLVLTRFNPLPFLNRQPRCLPSLAAVNFF